MPADPVQTLREHDLQVTVQRLAVLRAVTARPHATANEFADDVRREIGAISRQSVYDTLVVLTERDIVRRIQPAGFSARYEDRVGDNHHHLICRSCERLVDVECVVDGMVCLAPLDSGDFVVDEAEVTFWGICHSCRPSHA